MGLLPWVRNTHILGPLIASLFIGSVQSRWNEHGLCDVKPVSIWEPFCNEEVLYQPYVRVFHKGRNGALLRDRGPGFIDLSGLKDIYVCTNGLVMLYYEKTTAMGEVFERGELHWSAHTCELYNPSSNNGMKADFPKKCLLSILLIGHPQDYRMPAMQMFVAPLYDPKYGSYVNATSLIMIGEDGECLIEKGAERARLRVRLVRPTPSGAAKDAGAAGAAGDQGRRRRRKRAPGDEPKDQKKELEKAPIFCQLDVQRKLGQYKNIITLANPNVEEPVKFEYPFRKADAKAPDPPAAAAPAGEGGGKATPEPDSPAYDPFRGTPFSKGGSGSAGKRETGSSVYPRYSALEQLLGAGAAAKPADGGTGRRRRKRDTVEASAELKQLAEMADDVYTGLLADRKMRFIGCLRYPYFSSEQLDIIFLKNESLPEMKDKKLDESELFVNNTPSKDEGKGPAFWQQYVWKLPWPPADPSKKDAEELAKINKTRFEHYWEGDDPKTGPASSYQKLIVDVLDKENQTVQQKLLTQNTTIPKEEQEKNKKEYNSKNNEYMKAKVMLSLWPYKKAYAQIRDQVQKVCEKAATMWDDLYKKVTGDTDGLRTTTLPTTVSTDKDKPADKKKPDYEKLPPYDLAITRKIILEKLSFTIYDRRFQPYNPRLVKEHEELEQQYAEVDKWLKRRSIEYGPVISKIETMHSRCKMYKDLFVKSVVELEQAVKHAERSQGPAPVMYGGDPFERSFVDTNIDISDAKKAPEVKEYYKPDDDDYEAAKACRELPAPKATCKAIKPSSIRAGQMLKNRKGKGPDFETDDEWRDKIFDLIEKIFVKVCPYMNEEFPTAINRIVKGYLMGDPAGTGLEKPVNGSMLEIYNHHYQGIIYNDTYQRINPSNFTKPKSSSEGWIPKPKLSEKQEFWDFIIQALEHCEEHAAAMQFWHNEEGDKPAYVTYRKFFQNNNTEVHYDVEDLVMQEKADQEFAFNWAIDMNWRIFATVLGVCMPKYEFKIPLISARFYALYSQDFLSPLRQIWMSNRDNVILKLIMGNFYGACKGDKWARICMESSFVESGDRSYRPPRYLYVNAFTEMNYFTTGPMAGTSGILNTVGNR